MISIPDDVTERVARSAGLRLLLAFVGLVVVDRGTQLAARGGASDAESASLLLAAITRNPLLWLLALAAFAAVAAVAGARLLDAWHEYDQGAALRWFAGVVVLLLAWRFALYPYNWYAGQWHLLDRLVVVALAAAVIVRPIALVPFVAVVRVVSDHFSGPLPASSSLNIRDFAVLAAMAVAAVVLARMLTVVEHSDALPLLLAALVATHFWAAGLEKVRLGWLFDNDVANLPRNAQLQGWLGHTDGAFAERMGDVLDGAGWLVMLAVLVFELGFACVVAHRGLFRVWLWFAVAFHVATLLLVGYVFVDWIVVEVAVFAFLRQVDRDWIERAWDRRRAIAVAVVVAVVPSALVFHPPRLAWFDTPVVSTYELVAVTDEGERRVLDANDLAPHVEAFAFGSLHIGPREPLVAGYGVTATSEAAELVAVSDLVELETIERAHEFDEGRRALLVHVIERFIAHQASGRGDVWLPSLPSEFQTSARSPAYEGESITSIEVFQVTTLRTGERTEIRRELALVVATR